MANSITGFSTFTPRTKIQSSPVNTNFSELKNKSPLWQKYTVAYTSFTALGAVATGSVTLCSITAAEILDYFIIKPTTAFVGTSITAGVFKVGKTGSGAAYVDEYNALGAVSSANVGVTNFLAAEFSSTTMILTMSVTGGLLNQLSQGSIDIYVRRAELP